MEIVKLDEENARIASDSERGLNISTHILKSEMRKDYKKTK